jgi:hypothetical protein
VVHIPTRICWLLLLLLCEGAHSCCGAWFEGSGGECAHLPTWAINDVDQELLGGGHGEVRVAHSSPFPLTRHSVLSTSGRLCDRVTLRRGEGWRGREGEGAMMCVNPTQATTVASGAREGTSGSTREHTSTPISE